MGAGEFALNCALRVLQGWRFSLDNSTPAMFAMRIVAANRYVRGKRNEIGKGSARPVCAGRDEVRIESVGRTRSRQESLTQRLQLHKGGRSEILQGTAHSNVDGSGTVAARHLAGSCRKFIKTDGQKALGNVDADRVAIGVFSDALDAQYDWQAFTPAGELALRPSPVRQG